MPAYIEKIEKLTLPVVALGGAVAFPNVSLNFELEDEASVAAVAAATATDSFALLLPLQPSDEEPVLPDDFAAVGTVCAIRQHLKNADGSMRMLCEGFYRAEVIAVKKFADYYLADVLCKTLSMQDNGGVEGEALLREARRALAAMTELLPTLTDEIKSTAGGIHAPGHLADFIAANVLVRFEDKLSVLESFDPMERLHRVVVLMGEERELLTLEMNIHHEVREHLARNQKDFYLREQMRVIQDELGEGADGEIDEYERRIREAALPKEVEKKLLKENERMAKTPFGSAEASVLRGYLDVCLELPWNSKTSDRIDIEMAREILEHDHDGLEKVKERILEYLAVKRLNPELRNQIICLVGPPGVGKTSVAQSIARAMGRKYVRVSLGGVRDEADIRGHRKTYLGAMPGRIMAALTQVGVNNPVMLLDEIDKLTRDNHGDPSSALLEVLDGEQNKSFRDHFVELPFDLSDCVFIATANSLSTVPKPLIDRMEIIELSSYTKNEKMSIAKHYLLDKQLVRHGLTRSKLRISDEAIASIIDDYTREAGVRNLERRIADICRKAARYVAEGMTRRQSVTPQNLPDYLGPRKLTPERIADEDLCGVVNGLAFTEQGGDLLKVEALVFPGEGKVELTGSLGDVMKESARIAVSYIRAHAAELGVAPDFYKTNDLHVHFPEGAVPKDGPSAGAAMVTALVSALTDRPVRRDVAMTGEITLRGRVLAIGGLKEKTMAAAAAGVKTVLIPADNMREIPLLDKEAVAALELLPCQTLADVLSHALVGALPADAAKPAAGVRKTAARRKSAAENGKNKGEQYGV